MKAQFLLPCAVNLMPFLSSRKTPDQQFFDLLCPQTSTCLSSEQPLQVIRSFGRGRFWSLDLSSFLFLPPVRAIPSPGAEPRGLPGQCGRAPLENACRDPAVSFLAEGFLRPPKPHPWPLRPARRAGKRAGRLLCTALHFQKALDDSLDSAAK